MFDRSLGAWPHTKGSALTGMDDEGCSLVNGPILVWGWSEHVRTLKPCCSNPNNPHLLFIRQCHVHLLHLPSNGGRAFPSFFGSPTVTPPVHPRVRPPPRGWEVAFLVVSSAGLSCLLGDIHEDPSGPIIVFLDVGQ